MKVWGSVPQQSCRLDIGNTQKVTAPTPATTMEKYLPVHGGSSGKARQHSLVTMSCKNEDRLVHRASRISTSILFFGFGAKEGKIDHGAIVEAESLHPVIPFLLSVVPPVSLPSHNHHVANLGDNQTATNCQCDNRHGRTVNSFHDGNHVGKWPVVWVSSKVEQKLMRRKRMDSSNSRSPCRMPLYIVLVKRHGQVATFQ